MDLVNKDILKNILLQEFNETFEENPMAFILNKYQGLKTTLEYLMTPSFGEYITAIYVVAPKPTTFKILLHNGQFFFLQFMGKAYQATIQGKNYYLMTIGEKERAMVALSRLLRFGNPLKTKGPEGAEQATREAEGPDSELGAEPTPEGGQEAPPEELAEISNIENKMKVINISENKILESILLNEISGAESLAAEKVIVILMNNKSKIKTVDAMSNFLSSEDENALFLVGNYNKYMKKSGIPIEQLYFNAITKIPESAPAAQLGETKYKTTEDWINFGGIKTVTSKTDILSSAAKYSVKNGNTAVRVLDASVPQATALINYTINKLNYDEEIKSEISKSVNKLKKLSKQSSFKLSRKYGEGRYGEGRYGLKDLKGIPDEELQELIAEFEKNTDDLNKSVDKIFKKAQQNPKFSKTFIYESITGEGMLSKKSPGCAQKILTFEQYFADFKVIPMNKAAEKISSSYTIPKFGTKTSGNRITKTLQQGYKEKPVKEELQEIVNEFNKTILLKEQFEIKKILLEADALQKGAEYIKNKFKELIDRLSEFFNNLINKIIEFAKESYNKALSLFGIQVEIESLSYDANITYNEL
jgi:hypothetical protein